MSAKLAVCVIDDDADLRASLKLLFRSKSIPYLAFGSAEEFFDGYEQKPVGCVILDLKLPGTTGIDILRQMREKNVYLPVILATGHADVQTAVKAMKSGALDVIEKPFDNNELIEKVQAAFAKADHLRNFASERKMIEPKFRILTRREIEILDLMVAGVKNRKIAEDLGISPKTLDIHRANIMKKLDTKTVADLVRWRLISRADEAGNLPIIVRA